MRTLPKDNLITAAFAAAARYRLEPALVCAVIEQESNWNPWAIRYEPGCVARYIAPLKLKDETEAQSRAFSYGLMQVTGYTARDAGFKGKYLAELCDVDAGLDIGCAVLAKKMKGSANLNQGLLNWNGGTNKQYPDEVLARMKFYEGLNSVKGRAG